MLDVVNRLKADLFKAISHPTRIQILEYLRGGERCVCEVIEELELEQSNVSQHLGILKKQDLVAARKEGTKMMYRLKHPEVMDVMDLASRLLDRQLDETREALHFIRKNNEL
ncbi:MAG: metalloregulator ArsR/SmtB family transcription factor [Bacillota bacterium]|nr:metalloregulator ArsR/SmtB family transcription factor [Bacillota bacterium]MDW7683081.1 metalloregulator ArsR/SmtB family transcription factor [Bacillota bacterium]